MIKMLLEVSNRLPSVTDNTTTFIRYPVIRQKGAIQAHLCYKLNDFSSEDHRPFSQQTFWMDTPEKRHLILHETIPFNGQITFLINKTFSGTFFFPLIVVFVDPRN